MTLLFCLLLYLSERKYYNNIHLGSDAMTLFHLNITSGALMEISVTVNS